MKKSNGTKQPTSAPILILHGWARDMTGQRYHELVTLLENEGFHVSAPDLPGFGENTLQKETLTFDDYVSFVYDFVKKITAKTKNKKVILLGHSFGGRIAIRFTSLYPMLLEKLILTGASGIPRPLPSLKKRIAFFLTKLLRPIFSLPPLSVFYRFFRKLVYYAIGELDYYKAGNLEKTFKNVYQVSILSDLPNITVPTLIVWGQKDSVTPLADGKLFHAKIKGSKLHVVQDIGHRLPYEKPREFEKLVVNFIHSS